MALRLGCQSATIKHRFPQPPEHDLRDAVTDRKNVFYAERVAAATSAVSIVDLNLRIVIVQAALVFMICVLDEYEWVQESAWNQSSIYRSYRF